MLIEWKLYLLLLSFSGVFGKLGMLTFLKKNKKFEMTNNLQISCRLLKEPKVSYGHYREGVESSNTSFGLLPPSDA